MNSIYSFSYNVGIGMEIRSLRCKCCDDLLDDDHNDELCYDCLAEIDFVGDEEGADELDDCFYDS